MSGKTGVYVCECGTNISDAVDVDGLVEFASGLPGVALAKKHRLLCSQEGCEFLAEEIGNAGLERVVIAACSPREHEQTFRKACAGGGINPFMCQMANIRELAAWVTGDRDLATKKSESYIRAAVNRVMNHRELEKRRIDCVTDVLVIGAGVAGMEAALTLAQKGRKVFLVEKAPYIGGKIMKYDEVAPNLECSSCMLEPKMDELLHNERIRLLTCSEVRAVLGYYGNFIVTVRKKARGIDMEACIGCGACYPACPAEAPSEFDEGLSLRKAIYVAYTGALPNVPRIDSETCLRFKGRDCTACRDICPFGAVDYDQTDEDVELSVGAIIVATGFEVLDCLSAPQYGSGALSGVYSNLQFERMLCSNGPTQGKLLTRDGRIPESVAIIQCAGRGKGGLEYCSDVCCMNSLKLARIITERSSGTSVSIVHADWCLPGKSRRKFYDRTDRSRINLVRVGETADVSVSQKDGRLVVEGQAPGGGRINLKADMVVLSAGMAPGGDTAAIADMLGISRDEYGFFAEGHGRIAPFATPVEGVLIAGSAQGPMDIAGSVTSGAATAGKVLSGLVQGEKLDIEAIVAEIDADVCGGCRICMGMCPYKAITFNEEKNECEVNDVLCKGCGTCAAACPSGAAESRHFTKEQVFAEIDGVLQ